MSISSLLESDSAKWVALAIYMGISELIRRKKLGDSYIESRIKLERELSAKVQKATDDNIFSAYLEIGRFLVSKYKIYKSNIIDSIPSPKDVDEGVILNCILKVENKIRAHILANHIDDLSMTDLELYIDYITNEALDTIESYLKNKKLYSEYMKHFDFDDIRKINVDIIHTAISIKKRIGN